MVGSLPEASSTVKTPVATVPVVTIFCDPKSGEIFVPAIAALASTFELTIPLLSNNVFISAAV